MHNLIGFPANKLLTTEGGGSVGWNQSGDRVDDRSLAGTIWADEEAQIAMHHRQIEVLYGHEAVELHMQSTDFQIIAPLTAAIIQHRQLCLQPVTFLGDLRFHLRSFITHAFGLITHPPHITTQLFEFLATDHGCSVPAFAVHRRLIPTLAHTFTALVIVAALTPGPVNPSFSLIHGHTPLNCPKPIGTKAMTRMNIAPSM